MYVHDVCMYAYEYCSESIFRTLFSLSTYICMYMYACICMHVCMYVCMYVYTHACIHVCMHIHLALNSRESIFRTLFWSTARPPTSSRSLRAAALFRCDWHATTSFRCEAQLYSFLFFFLFWGVAFPMRLARRYFLQV